MPLTLVLLALGLLARFSCLPGTCCSTSRPAPTTWTARSGRTCASCATCPSGRVRVGARSVRSPRSSMCPDLRGLRSRRGGVMDWLVWLAAALLALALICGGAYHAQYVYLSVIAKAEREELYDEVADNIMFVMRFATVPMYLGFVVLGVAIVLGTDGLSHMVCRPHAAGHVVSRPRVDARAAAGALRPPLAGGATSSSRSCSPRCSSACTPRRLQWPKATSSKHP